MLDFHFRYPAYMCQIFATTRWTLLFFGLGALIQGFFVNGHTSAIISTLEKRWGNQFWALHIYCIHQRWARIRSGADLESGYIFRI